MLAWNSFLLSCNENRFPDFSQHLTSKSLDCLLWCNFCPLIHFLLYFSTWFSCDDYHYHWRHIAPISQINPCTCNERSHQASSMMGLKWFMSSCMNETVHLFWTMWVWDGDTQRETPTLSQPHFYSNECISSSLSLSLSLSPQNISQSLSDEWLYHRLGGLNNGILGLIIQGNPRSICWLI